jgi:hypothetical protein
MTRFRVAEDRAREIPKLWHAWAHECCPGEITLLSGDGPPEIDDKGRRTISFQADERLCDYIHKHGIPIEKF